MPRPRGFSKKGMKGGRNKPKGFKRSYPRGKGGKKKKRQPLSIFAPLSREQIRRTAEREVGLEIRRATQPLREERTGLATRRRRELGEIGSLFETLQPFVGRSAARLGNFAEEARADEQRIYEAATRRLGELNQNQAAEAQQLSQTLGAEVPVETFTEQTEGAQADLDALSATGQLSSIGGQGADVAAAEAFAGRVFPMIRGQQEKETRQMFSDAINQLNSEISDIRKQRGAAISQRFADRLIAEREFALGKLQADRDFGIARQTLGLQRGELTGEYRGKPTLAAKQLREQRKQFRIGTREERQRWTAEYNLQIESLRQDMRQARTEKGARRSEMRGQAYALATALTSPGEREKVSYTTRIATSAGSSGAFESPPGSGKWWLLKNVSKNVRGPAMVKDPWNLYKQLVNNGIPKRMARQVTIDRYGLGKGWKPGNRKGPGKKGWTPGSGL